MSDKLDELLRRAREYNEGDLGLEQWIETTEALTPQETTK